MQRLEKRLSRDKDNIFLLTKKAEIAKYMNDIDSMQQAYEQILELSFKRTKIITSYALNLDSLGNPDQALQVLDNALSKEEVDFDILKTKGAILLELARNDEAIQAYQNALEFNPDDYAALTQMGIALRRLGDYKKSICFLNQALSISPKYRAAKYEKQKTYQEIYCNGPF